MTTVALIRSRPHTRYFVNCVHRTHPLSLVVIEKPKASASFARAMKKGGVVGLAKLAFRRSASTERNRRLDAVFGDAWKQIDADIPTLIVESINAPEVHDRLSALSPHLLLDHGTSIVADQVIDTSDIALNLHWGLSPHYRGVSCTEWALINWDPYNIGVTIHILSKHIDGGHIVAQERVEVRPGDRVEDINHRITAVGTGLTKRIVSRLLRGEPLNTVPQDPQKGHLFLKRHFGKRLRVQVKYLEREGLIEQMLAKPSRKEMLPIVTLDESVIEKQFVPDERGVAAR